MRVLIVSDTHGRHSAFEKALNEAGKIDYLVHLGDTEGGEDYIEAVCGCPAYVLAGNNDFFSDCLREMEIMFGPKKAFMTHGHYYYVSLGPERIVEEGKARGADIVMFGHTHKPFLEEIDGMTVLNPGSLSYPRQEGRKGSYIIMEMDGNGDARFEIKYLENKK
ncbi:MAG: metallophosphoesterase [Bariatricus sp.]|nr:metallophosphoesterase [Bariatricus sp.]